MRSYSKQRQRLSLAFLASLGLAWLAGAAVAEPLPQLRPRVLTLTDAIESVRFMTDRQRNAVFVSPAGRHYAVVLVQGDVARDGVWWELKVGDLTSLAAATPRTVVRMFSQGRGATYEENFGSDELTTPGMNAPVWMDEQRLAFFWEDERGVRQVFAAEVSQGTVMPVTRHPTPVIQFGMSPQGTLMYTATTELDRTRLQQRQRDGYVVTDQDVPELLSGVRGAWDWMFNERFVVTDAQSVARRIAFEGGEATSRYLPLLSPPVFARDGRFAITPHSLAGDAVPPAWTQYTLEHFQHMGQALRQDPQSYYARQFEKLFVVDVHRATARALWEVPNHPLGRTRIAWSPRGDRVVLGPTFLPVASADADGLAGLAVADVEVRSGRYRRVPVPGAQAGAIRQIRWTEDEWIEIRLADGSTLALQRRAGVWTRARDGRAAHMSAAGGASRVQVDVRQSLTQPPVLVARNEASGQEHVVLDPNPALGTQIRLGRVDWVHRTTSDGAPWEGRLYFPVNYQPGRRYPLVFQTYAFAPRGEFSLYGHEGPALGPGRSAYIAQLLAGRDMFVLHGPSRAEAPAQVNARLDALENIIEQLVAEGLVDRERVGIMGFSASGWLTTYALARGRFPYAAALTDDNKDGSYLQAALSGWAFSSGQEMIGAAPFGAGLQRWIEQSPAWNVERFRTPLLLTRTSPRMELAGWELFSRLRYLHKPVEYYFIPDLEHGSHGLQNPTQILALQGRALDWWCYWLKDEHDPDPRKAQQYARWDALRAQHAADLPSHDATP